MSKRPRFTQQRWATLCSALAYLEGHAEDIAISGDEASARELQRQIDSASDWVNAMAEESGFER
jgi:hypothetical protein